MIQASCAVGRIRGMKRDTPVLRIESKLHQEKR